MPPKVIIIAAGPTRTGKYRFPPNAKPKNLFHYNGETLLDRQLRMFRECGIESFRLVVGYRANDLIAYNKTRGLGLEIVCNPHWEGGIFHTIWLSLEGLDEDVILVWGDTVFLSKAILEAFLSASNPLVCLNHGKTELGRGSPDAFKIDREKLPLVRKIEEYDDIHDERYDAIRATFALQRLVGENGGLIMYVQGVTDIDFYGQTDEGGGRKRRKKRRLRLAREGKRK